MDWETLENDPRAFLEASGLPMPSSFPSPDEVRKERSERAGAIFKAHGLLHDTLERYEAVIRKRWLKKSNSQRIAILTAAWGSGISKIHRPDFDAFLREPDQQRVKGTRFRDAYIWPYINLDDLSKGKILLLFLNTRGRHQPHEFAHVDLEQMHLGITSTATMPAFLNGYTMIFGGRCNASDYGQLYDWDENTDASEWMLEGEGVNPGEGLLILQIQQRTLEFLNRCCQSILHEYSIESLSDKTIEIQPEPPHLLPSLDEAGYLSLTALALEAPYRVPENLDLSRLQVLLESKRSAAEDNIWSLREDPSYFAETVLDVSEHNNEQILDINGRKHPNLTNNSSPLTESPFWERILTQVVREAYSRLISLTVACEQMSQLRSLQEKYSKQIIATKRLPEDFELALYRFKYYMKQLSKGALLMLRASFPASPPVRHLWLRQPQEPNSTIIRIGTKKNIGSPQSDRILHLYMMLIDEKKVFLCGLPPLVDEYEYILRTEPSEKERITSFVASTISDIGFMAEIERQIGLYQPWATLMDRNLEAKEEEHMEDFRKKSQKILLLTKYMPLSGGRLEQVGRPEKNRFFYPVNKRRTKTVTESLRVAEQNLDEFWERVDRNFSKASGQSLHKFLGQVLPSDRELQRTLPWEKVDTQSTHNLKQDFVPLPQTSTKETSQSLSKPVSSTKVKTKGVSSAIDSYEIVKSTAKISLSDETTRIVFKLGRRAYKTFSTLFYTATNNDPPGELPWLEFLYAMQAVGFSPQKQYGSIWLFSPDNLDVNRSINFHEPHPRKKLTFFEARRYGRRLGRAYGWTIEQFSLDE